MKIKVTCRNTTCKHYISEDGCDTDISLNVNGKCESYEKGFNYYFNLVWNALENKNYIDMVEIQMNPDIRIGLYYVMSVFGLGFSESEYGTCRFIMLKDGADGKGLNYEQIREREMDKEVLYKLYDDFNNGILPHAKEQEPTPVTTSGEFGWLSPTGDFLESPFGHHEESAQDICEKKGFLEEYREWEEAARSGTDCHCCRDFLQEVKGYCLIHNPIGDGGYVVTNTKNLTKQQKEFLYGYFTDLGDRFKAEMFLED